MLIEVLKSAIVKTHNKTYKYTTLTHGPDYIIL